MVSSFSIFFIIAFYFYFKQRYTKLIDAKIEDPGERVMLHKNLKRKLMILPAGAIAVIILYIISFLLMRAYPDVDNVKESRRVVDAVAVVIVMVLFVFDKREIDERLNVKKPHLPPVDVNEPGIDIPENEEIV